jgi:two-component sensor histidine kinase/ligand-binding sensor domain-containing protein
MFRIHSVLAFVFIFAQCACYAQLNRSDNDFIVTKEFITVDDGLASRSVYCAVKDKNGFIWFGTKNGLNRYDGKNFKLFTTKEGLSYNLVLNIELNDNNLLLIQYGSQWGPVIIPNKIDVIDASTLKVESYQEALSKKHLKKTDQASVKSKSSRIKEIAFTSCNDKRFTNLQEGRIYETFDNKAQLLVNPAGGVFYIENNQTLCLLNPPEIDFIDNWNINHFFRDGLNNIWLCTSNGVVKISLKPNYFQSFFTKEEMGNTLYQIRGISVATVTGNNKIFANANGAIFVNNRNLINNGDFYWGILQLKNTLYSGAYFLTEYDLTSNKQLGRYSIDKNKDEIIFTIFQKDENTLYLGRTTNICAYNRLNHTSRELKYKNTSIPKIKNVYRIFQSSKGVVAIAENGIYLIENDRIIDYFGSNTKNKRHYLPIKEILDVHEDKNKCLWIATNGDGLFKWNWNKNGSSGELQHIKSNDGLPSMVLYRIEEDQSNNLWISSDDGICCLNTLNYQVRKFSLKDGLPHYEFNRTSSFKSEDGWIYFGSINGLVGFNPEELNTIHSKQNVPFNIVEITMYSTDYEKKLDWSLNSKYNKITWLPTDRLLKIEFALLDYKIRKKQFAYRILGVQNTWIYTNNSSISIGNLPYGEYDIEIKAQLEDGTWLNNTIKIPIIVIAPFYLKTWFVALSALIFIGLVTSVIWFRSKRLKKQNVKLETIIAERTEDLNMALEDKDILLKELHHRVKNNLQIITGLLELQKEQLTDEKAIQALNEGQIRLTSIALIHQNFYGGTNLEKISFYAFLMNLTTHSKELFENENRIIEYIIHPNEINIDIDNAIPLGLIVNELLTNSYKYIPLLQVKKSVEINLEIVENGTYELTFKDNGPGLPPNINFDNSQTLGLKLIRGLSQQIRGAVTYHYDQGSVFTITFKGKSKTK